MKRLITIITISLLAFNSFSQTNTFPPNGNVGIGSSILYYNLNLGGNVNSDKTFGISRYSGTSTGGSRFIVKSTPKGLVIGADVNINQPDSYIHLSHWDSNLSKLINGFSYHNGNVGIGTSKLFYNLNLGGNINSDKTFGISRYSSTSTDASRYLVKSTSTGLVIGADVNINQPDSYIHFAHWDSNLSKLVNGFSYHNGNVGIGTMTTGTHKLAVDGTIGAREIKVEATGWSDFVFNDNYNLKDLEEVENFIKENNRLPDVPSEKEVLENGIQLGEMDAKLLQKIEELTLYMIEQNKMMKAQNEEIQNLKKEIKILKTQ